MKEQVKLEQVLSGLAQPEPSGELDAAILGNVRRMLALENYQKAESLLLTQGDRLDQSTRVGLATGMAEIREKFGPGFGAAYQQHLQAQAQSEPEPGPDDLQR